MGREVTQSLDIVLRSREGPLCTTLVMDIRHMPHCTTSSSFAMAEDGWSYSHRLTQPQKANPDRMTQTRYFAYQLHPRQGEFSALLHGGNSCSSTWWMRGLQQNKIGWHICAAHQQDIRASLYSGLEDALELADENADLNEIGQRVILPSSYQGSPRHMYQIFQDAMALARFHRKVDLFITMTANPKWREVLDALFPGQKSGGPTRRDRSRVQFEEEGSYQGGL